MALDQVLAELTAKVGTEVHVSDWLTITQERINQFADATGDHQWIHVDPEHAKTGPFGSTIAHAMMIEGCIAGLTDAAERVPGARIVLNYGTNRVRYPNFTRVGSRIRFHSVLQSAEAIGDDCIQVITQFTAEIEGEEKPAVVVEGITRHFL